MPPRKPLITLIRHGEGHHNPTHDTSIPDPLLTPLGTLQALTIPTLFPSTPKVTHIFCSPLRRTLQTCHLAFGAHIESTSTNSESTNADGEDCSGKEDATGKEGVEGELRLRVTAVPQLQESSSKPCDTGSPLEELRREWPAVQWGMVEAEEPGWRGKRGFWGEGDETLKERARWVRSWLWSLVNEGDEDGERRHVVCVLHGHFLHHLTRNWAGFGVKPWTPTRAGWMYAEFRTFEFVDDADPDDPELEETVESRVRRRGYLPAEAEVEVKGPFTKIPEAPVEARYRGVEKEVVKIEVEVPGVKGGRAEKVLVD